MASVRKRGSQYMGLYRDSEGSQRSAGSYPTEKQALKAARLGEAGMPPVKGQQVFNLKVRGKQTVASYADEWLPGHPLSAHARYVYNQMLVVHIIPALGNRALADITTADIRQFFRQLEAKGTSAALGKKIKCVLSSMLQVAAEDGKIPFNPVRGMKFNAAPPKRRRALTLDEWRRVRKYLDGEYRLLCDVVMATGARIEEVLGMEVKDIKDGVWTISRVRNQVDGVFSTKDYTKTGMDRQVRLPQSLVKEIMAGGPGRVFTDFLLNSFRMLHWYPACRMAELDWRPAPRDLRRSFATLARANGADLEAVRMALGHTRIATTDVYLGERPDARDDAFLAVQRALSA